MSKHIKNKTKEPAKTMITNKTFFIERTGEDTLIESILNYLKKNLPEGTTALRWAITDIKEDTLKIEASIFITEKLQ